MFPKGIRRKKFADTSERNYACPVSGSASLPALNSNEDRPLYYPSHSTSVSLPPPRRRPFAGDFPQKQSGGPPPFLRDITRKRPTGAQSQIHGW